MFMIVIRNLHGLTQLSNEFWFFKQIVMAVFLLIFKHM